MLQQLLEPWTLITPRRVGGAVVTAAVCCSLQGLKVIPDECRVTAATVISSLSQEGTFGVHSLYCLSGETFNSIWIFFLSLWTSVMTSQLLFGLERVSMVTVFVTQA